ncbi:MAG: alpha/beta fold hydrolase [Croceitalea sp.]|nr:alpha/beta fold hydrolase [Croceitalea sp.]
MPKIESKYNPPLLFKNGHIATIYAGAFRKVNGLVQKRERLQLSDGDFLDLDWSQSPSTTKKVVVLLHGLEGNAQRPYILGSAKLLNQNGFDACAVNFRSCSGTPNTLYRSYHSGATEDLSEVISHLLHHKDYQQIYLMGFSLGGNLAMKYLGENNILNQKIKGAVGVSIPCDLANACEELLKPKNMLYAQKFKKNLIAKLRVKQSMFPDCVSVDQINNIITLKDFDDVYTSRAHGFKDANQYYAMCSCRQFLEKINVPSLIINAKNDSFLGALCFPFEEAQNNQNLLLETPQYGGHVGFWGQNNISYVEGRALQFFNSL